MIKVKNLNIEFNGKVYIEDLNFTVEQGEKAVITGPSGIGKSSIFHSLLGFYVPDKAEIEIYGQELNSSTVHSIRAIVAWLPQNMNLFGDTKFKDVIDKIAHYKGNKELDYTSDRVNELMKNFKLDKDLLDQEFKELSGGEKQRAGMVIALLLNRPIILLDEPGSALDKDTKQRAMDIFLNDPNLTVLSVSHDEEWISSSTKEIKIAEKKN